MPLNEALKLANQAFSHFDSAAARLGTSSSDGSMHLQCAKGCSSCCHIEVGVSPLEVIAIKSHLEQPENRSNIERLKTRIRHSRKAVGELWEKNRKAARIPCPLLDASGSCSVYPVRPIACRAYVSFDRAGCERDWRDPGADHPVARSETLLELSTAMGPGVVHAHERAGLHFWGYELIRALHIAFSTPDFERKCFSGQDVLAKASMKLT